ncbi:type II toxin-antitoxin system VapC family toxin [Herbiconiux sp. VKM Ac-1786]|uniref:type II toxin-antitoxin system VapC family toxin n=1 Tax=Herbiconiux sp. VKM Ac-1786 TaxID=2783824 RepID=UPI00188A713C|nr:type II toxin-antitoxin system VapC family toxin [Herbiconiux sp. VKM Ac-1786]MBF4572760.1 type II toxin-antitoxin system VapC family toxin [Herbiconiux sp. VKM Ac-1786]
MIYADSNILIYLIEDPGERGDRVRRRFDEIDDELVVSPLVIMECRVKPLQLGDLVTVRRFDRLFDHLPHLDMPEEVYLLAADTRARHGLKTMDALHLATAQFHTCDGFWTQDDRLKAAAGGLAIETF